MPPPVTDATFAYLGKLSRHNEKAWFDAHRAAYERDWRDAGLDLVAALSEGMQALPVPLIAEPRLNGSLRRINRDVRFSADKTPYNARLHLVFWTGGHPNRSPGFHLVLTPTGVGYGAGIWGLEPAALARVRARIDDAGDRADLEAALVEAESVHCTLGEPDLARVPKGYAADHTGERLLRYKGFVARTRGYEAEAGRVTGPDAVDWILGLARATNPLLGWLDRS